eukprot:7701400-Pyramimonas_sp.AAC.1
MSHPITKIARFMRTAPWSATPRPNLAMAPGALVSTASAVRENSPADASIHPPAHQFTHRRVNTGGTATDASIYSPAGSSIHPPAHQFTHRRINSPVDASIHPPAHQFTRRRVNTG